jgi:hypothetical protein
MAIDVNCFSRHRTERLGDLRRAFCLGLGSKGEILKVDLALTGKRSLTIISGGHCAIPRVAEASERPRRDGFAELPHTRSSQQAPIAPSCVRKSVVLLVRGLRKRLPSPRLCELSQEWFLSGTHLAVRRFA